MFKNRNYRNMTAGQRALHIMEDAIPDGYKMGKIVQGKSLKAGMKVLAYYNSTNQGCDAVEILGVTDNDEKYGDGGPKFTSVKECLKAHDCKTLDELDKADDNLDAQHGEWGFHTYLYTRDLNHDLSSNYEESGAWYYIFEGRWARGSGAEKLSFVELLPIEKEAVLKVGSEMKTIEVPNRVYLVLDEMEIEDCEGDEE